MIFGNIVRSGLRRARRCLSYGSPCPLNETISIDNFRKIQLESLLNLKPENFDKCALYHFIADFLVKPEKPDLRVAERLLNAFHQNLYDIDSNGELPSLYLIQLFESKDASAAQKAVDFVAKLFENVESRKCESPIAITSFMIEFIWENLIKTSSNEAGRLFYDTCVKYSSLLENCGFTFDIAFKERLLLELFLPCRNQAMVDRIISDSVSDGKICVNSSTLLEIFKVFTEPEIEDPYPEVELFSDSTTLPRFHALVDLLKHWKESGIPIKGDSVSKALSGLFQKFLPSNSMLKQLESVI